MKFDKYKYKPLPDNVTIQTSTIDGLGLHATKFIEKYVSLGITHINDDRFENGLIRLPLGGFINHSEIPNCMALQQGDFKILVPIRDIEPGEELTLNYFLEKKLFK